MQQNKKTLDIILLIALPASGKSEVRKYLEQMPVEKRIADFHLGDTVQFDDFPYVHLMRCVDLELMALNQQKLFYHAPDNTFLSTLDWGTLIELLNEDYADIVSQKVIKPASIVDYYLDRIDAASVKVGLPRRIATLSTEVRDVLRVKLEQECAKMFADKQKLQAASLEGKTIVIEFARGGPEGAAMPLPNGYGYEYSLALLAEPILSKASVLYIWVMPEESRRKNQDRGDPNDPGSILHHCVPEKVMRGDYGCDDLVWLENHSEVPGTLTVKAHSRTFHLPIAKFDNRVDKTSFLRADPQQWNPEQVKAIHADLKAAFDKLLNKK